MLAGRQVSAAINDRFVLNTLYQFNHRVDLNNFMGHNACFTAGADKVRKGIDQGPTGVTASTLWPLCMQPDPAGAVHALVGMHTPLPWPPGVITSFL